MNRRQEGMTLIEVLIASVIFSLIMLATVSALRSFGFAFDRIDSQVEKTNRLREVSRFLMFSLRSALDDPDYIFGIDSELTWVAPIDRIGSAGGLQHLRLNRSGSSLTLSFAPFDPSATPDSELSWSQQVPDFELIERLDRLQINYKMTPEEGWRSDTSVVGPDGESKLAVPWAVSLQLTVGGEEWPPIVVKLDRWRAS